MEANQRTADLTRAVISIAAPKEFINEAEREEREERERDSQHEYIIKPKDNIEFPTITWRCRDATVSRLGRRSHLVHPCTTVILVP
jgi:hypothetical protein